MHWLKVFVGLWIVYAVGLFGAARLVSARLIASDIGSIYLRNGDEYGVLPVELGQCKVTESKTTCELMVGLEHLRLEYKLAQPFRIQGYAVVSEVCELTYADVTRTCQTMWVNHPARRVAYTDMTENLSVDLIRQIALKWPLENLSESTWMNLTMLNMLPIGGLYGLLWRPIRELQLTLKQKLLLISGVGLSISQFIYIFPLAIMKYFID